MKVVAILLALAITLAPLAEANCKLMGYHKQIEIEGCELITVQVNACRGCCKSTSFPSDYGTIVRSNRKHNITSKSSCCIIHAQVKRTFKITCGDEVKEKVIYSASECRCGLCEDV